MNDKDYEKRQGERLIIIIGCLWILLIDVWFLIQTLIGHYEFLKIYEIDNTFTRFMEVFI